MTRAEWEKGILDAIKAEDYKKALELMAYNSRDMCSLQELVKNFCTTFYDEKKDNIPALKEDPDAKLIMHCHMALFEDSTGYHIVASDEPMRKMFVYFQTWLQNLHDSMPLN